MAAADAGALGGAAADAEGAGLAPPPVQAATIGASAAYAPSLCDALQEIAPRQPFLDHVADQRRLDVDGSAVVSLGHDCSSSPDGPVPGPPPRTSASDGGQVTATSLPTGRRTPVLDASTDRTRPPAVRTW